MERGWERAHDFMELPARELERRVGGAFPGARLRAAQPLTAGLRNTNYRLEIEGGPSPLVLRLYVAEAAACAREAAVLAAIAGRVPAPRVLYCDPAATPPYAFIEWIEGRPLDSVLGDCDGATASELARACGTALAAIHGTRLPAPGFLGSEMSVIRPMPGWASAVIEALGGRVEERLGPELSAGVRAVVESNAPAVESVWSEAVLVLADYKPWNLLVDRPADGASDGPGGGTAWHVTGVLDWEFACAACKLIDFATFLRDEADRRPGFADVFAAAYVDAGGSLPTDWRPLTRLVDLLNLLQLLAWADHRAALELRRLVAEIVSAGELPPGSRGS